MELLNHTSIQLRAKAPPLLYASTDDTTEIAKVFGGTELGLTVSLAKSEAGECNILEAGEGKINFSKAVM